MEYIEVRAKKGKFYIEKDKIVSIVDTPGVFAIPDGDKRLSGLDFWGKRLVAYLNTGGDMAGKYGIILDLGEDLLYGLAVENVSEAAVESAALSPVMKGVWVMRNDTAD